MSRFRVGLFAGLTLIGLMVGATVPVVALVFLVQRVVAPPWFVWGLAGPVLYLAWLASFLRCSAALVSRIGSRRPKPRHLVLRPGTRLSSKDSGGMMTVGTCYRIYAVLLSTPFLSLFAQLPYLKTLIYRAYAPTVHIRETAVVMGRVLDPDLTDIGDFAVIGGNSAVVAHSMAHRPSGERVYVSAPISIGTRATVGGESLVSLGCVIGDDAVVEPGSVVEPFTRIPAGEVWGGNPARFRRRVDDAPQPEASSPVSGHETAGSVPSADAIRQLVIDALHLAPGEAAGEISSRTCARWDSLGQVAIAAAIYDRFGVAVQPRQVFGLTSLEAIAATIRGQATSAGDPRKGAADPIAADPEMLPLLDRGDAMQRLAELPAVPTATPIHLNVLATFTANALESAVALWGRGFGLAIDCHVAPYNQIVQGLLDPSGAFLARPGGVTVVLARTEDFGASAAVARAQLDHTLEAVARAAAAKPRGSRLLVGTLPPVVSAFSELDRAFAETLRYAWRSRVGDLDGVELFDFSEVVERLGMEAARSNEADALMRAGFSPQAHRELGIALVRQLRSARGAVAKVIALDCDNTLWGGVVGEVGVEGLELGPDGPGRAFQLFQRALKRMKERGVLLVVVSRNEPHDVREVFERHPEMVLRPDDIAAWRVNWNFKSQNLRELAAELNLGLDAFVFLDDDPAVRLEVKSRVPEVHVVPLPADPASYCETLDRLWLFDGAQTTAEDASRTQMTREEEQRRRERQSAASLDEFLASLDLEAEMRSADERDLPRVAQLTQRTNQFNVSLKRRTLEDIKAAATRATILVLSARDRFGDYGQVGVCILERGADPHTAEMDTFLMSCRALGRGVEDAFIHGIGVVAAEQGATELVARFVEGPRNAQVRDFLARSGFAEAASTGLWRRPLRELPPLPPHVRFVRPDAQELTAGRPRRL